MKGGVYGHNTLETFANESFVTITAEIAAWCFPYKKVCYWLVSNKLLLLNSLGELMRLARVNALGLTRRVVY